MTVRPPFQWPPDKERERSKAIRLEWLTLAGMGSVVLVVYFVLGNSQAMRTAWIEDMVGLVPAIIYLVAARVERRAPSEGFPFGFYRSFSIAYLFGATATLFVGLYLLAQSAAKLIAQEHPTIGLMSIFGYDVWAGWLMIAALIYSIIPPVVLGRLENAGGACDPRQSPARRRVDAKGGLDGGCRGHCGHHRHRLRLLVGGCRRRRDHLGRRGV